MSPNRTPCPTCGRLKPAYAIRDGRCKEDIWDEEHTGLVKAQQSWTQRKADNDRNAE